MELETQPVQHGEFSSVHLPLHWATLYGPSPGNKISIHHSRETPLRLKLVERVIHLPFPPPRRHRFQARREDLAGVSD